MADSRPVIACTTYRKLSHDTAVPLYGLMTSYVEAIRLAGGVPLLIPLSASEEELHAILSRVDGLMLPGGGDIDPSFYGSQPHPTLGDVDPDRDRIELFVARHAAETETPLLAICRGHQVLNVALGGTMWEDIASQRPASQRHDYFLNFPRTYLPHTVQLKPNSQLAGILGRAQTPVNSMHHQAVRTIADGLVISAESDDGIVEGLEHPDHPFLIGVQWHPENLVHDDPAMLALFQALVAAATSSGATSR